MRPLAVTLSMGVAFSAGMLVPLVGLHATENFRYLDYFGLIREDTAARGKPMASQRDAYPPQGTERAIPVPAPLLDAHDRMTIAERIPAPARMAHAPAFPNGAVAVTLSKTQIADIQTYLAVRGFEAGNIDGMLGPQTGHAIRAFEAAHDLPVTGAASPQLLRLLTEPAVSEPTPPTKTIAAVDLVQTAGAPMSLIRPAADR